MRVLFAIKGLHQAAGGAERVLCDVCSYLADHGKHEITLLTFDPPGTPPFYPLSSAVKLIQVGVGDPREPTSLGILLRRMVALRFTVREQHPDVVVAFMHSMFIPMAFALIGTGIPVLASEHIVMEYYRSRRAQFVLFAAAVPFIRRITVLSDAIASEYPKWIRQKMVSVTNPVSPVFQKGFTANDCKDPHRILAIGRFSKRKNHATLLAAFATLADEFPGWTLRILGDGLERPALQAEVIRLGLQDRVSLPGIVTDVIREMADASFFALASRYESFGLVFAEAMACGKASVAFADCQGVNDVLDDGETGLLVKGTDPVRSIADGLRRLMIDEEKRRKMGISARERVFMRFSVDKVCDRWQDILRDACR